jgi:glycerol-3-phosphate O-acyltransferase/dihydroxyacetone phosphate acyltransferase
VRGEENWESKWPYALEKGIRFLFLAGQARWKANYTNLIFMLYTIVRPLAAAALRVYLRKIFLSHTERIPKGKPVILACNHPTAFMEPCILACFLDRPLYFLVRGDFFAKPVYARILRALHMLPVYRLKDGGYRKLKDNFSTFEACHDALYRNQTIMIFAEGGTIYEKRLRPLQKGAARIAFGTLEKYPDIEDVYIVPVGVTYEAAHQFRSQVMIGFGEPILTRNYWQAYQRSPNEGIADFTDAIAEGMREQIVHIENKKDDKMVECLLTLHRSMQTKSLWPVISSRPEPLKQEKRLADMVNQLGEAEKTDFRRKLIDYFGALKMHEVSDADVKGPPKMGWAPLAFLILTFPAALLGYLLNFLPFWAARRLAVTKVEAIEFFSPVMVASGLVIYLLYFLLLLLIGGLVGGWSGLAAVIGVPFLGILTLAWLEYYWRWRSLRHGQKLPEKVREELLDRRKEIVAMMGGKMGRYELKN